MLNLYAVKVWHPSAPRYGETINIWTYTIDRAEYLAAESYPGCRGSCAAAGRPRRTQPTVAGQFPTVRWRRALESGELAAAADSGLGRGASREQAARRHSLRWPGGSRGPVELT